MLKKLVWSLIKSDKILVASLVEEIIETQAMEEKAVYDECQDIVSFLFQNVKNKQI